jgi:hypothetical protein
MTGRPRGDAPFIERKPSGVYRWRRQVPDDLKPVLGSYWNHQFPTSLPLEAILAAGEALTKQTDAIVAERRKRLGTIKMSDAG